MLIGGLIAVVVVLGILAAVLMLRRSHDDEHSVQHYHRQLHTLEEIRGHPIKGTGTAGIGTGAGAGAAGTATSGAGTAGTETSGIVNEGGEKAVFPASAFRISGSSTVRLTESDKPLVPPIPPPPVPNPSKPVTFDDASPDPVPATFMTGNEDRAIHTINHRPRRLGGPAAAVGAVLVLVLVLILTGLHSDTTKHHGKAANAATTTPTTHPATKKHHEATTTTSTTAPPSVSAPTASTAHTATYAVAVSNYSLTIAATTGQCWVDVTNPANGAVLFTTTLQAGQSHALDASGPVTVIAGAPGAFSATVNGAPVTLPPGNLAPFTLVFQPTTTTA